MNYISPEMLRALNQKAFVEFQNSGLKPTFSITQIQNDVDPNDPDGDGDNDADPDGDGDNDPLPTEQIPGGFQITIYDAIGTEQTNSNTLKTALDTANGAPITIRMASPGGLVTEGVIMHNMLKNYAGNTTIIVDGVLASIATVIAMGADRVLTANASMWMIHSASTIAWGNADEMRKTAEMLDTTDAMIAQTYADKSGGTAADWATAMAAETWYNGKQAVAAGLADGIVSPPAKAQSAPATNSASVESISASVADKTESANADFVRQLQMRARAALMTR